MPGEVVGDAGHLAREQCVLGAIFLGATDPALAAEVDRLGLDDFTDARHRAIFQAVIDLAAVEMPARLEDVTSRLVATGQIEHAGGVLYVTTLLHTAFSPTQVVVEAERLRVATTDRLLRTLAGLFLDAAETAREHPEAPAAVEALLRLAIAALTTAADRLPAVGLTAARTLRESQTWKAARGRR